jgi:dTDP-4-amino-4,6-dideoxygalactose transaminase
LRAEFLAAIAEVIDAGAFAGGPFVARFEQEFAAYCGTRSRRCGNGTDALWLALLALGIGPGDEVITVPMTFMATAEAITYCGARPVFVDIDDRTYTMDPDAPRSGHHPSDQGDHPGPSPGSMRRYGSHPRDRQPPRHPRDRGRLPGPWRTYKGRRAGSLGVAGCFSFYPGKNLGAFGEAGAITTNDSDLADRMRMFRDHGQARKYHHDVVGWNARMDGIQAAVLQPETAAPGPFNNAQEFLSLPMYPELTEDQIDAVSNALAEVLQHDAQHPDIAIGDGGAGFRI